MSAFFLLRPPTKQCTCDVILRAVKIWGQERGRKRVSGCATCEQSIFVTKSPKYRPIYGLSAQWVKMMMSTYCTFQKCNMLATMAALQLSTSALFYRLTLSMAKKQLFIGPKNPVKFSSKKSNYLEFCFWTKKEFFQMKIYIRDFTTFSIIKNLKIWFFRDFRFHRILD